MKQVVVITGGGRGIGAEAARLAAASGYLVIINYMTNVNAANAIVSTIKRENGVCFAFKADLAKEKDVLALFEFAKSKGVITALINNAGMIDEKQRLEHMSFERLDRIFSINLTGAFLCAREAVRAMSPKHGGAGGSIVNLTSAAAKLGAPAHYVDYASAKGAIETMTIGLAKEVAEDGIRVNAVRPSIIENDIYAADNQSIFSEGFDGQLSPDAMECARQAAMTIIWLISDDASYSSGKIIDASEGGTIPA